jgi:hypothetical protein
MKSLRKGAVWAYRILITLFAVGVAAEFVLAGLGVFRAMPGEERAVSHSAFDEEFDAHAGLGWALSGVSLLLVIAVLVAWTGRRSVVATLALAILTFVQPSLASAGEDAPVAGAFHAINALAIAGVAWFLTSWALRGNLLDSGPG